MTSAQKRRLWYENFRQAILTILSHKFRSFLTVLGVLVGVITVVLVASILTGMRSTLVDLIEKYGTRNIYAFHLNTGVQIGRRSRKEWERKPLKLRYAKVIKARCSAVEDVAVNLITRYLKEIIIKYQGLQYHQGRLEGVSANYLEVMNLMPESGRSFTPFEEQHRVYHCVIGHAVAESLFPYMNPVGKQLNVCGQNFTIIGVLEKKKSTLLGSTQEDSTVFIPISTLKKLSPKEDWYLFTIKAKEGMLSAAMDQVEEELRRLRKLKAKDEDDFSLSTSESVIKQFDRITAGVGLITIAISSVGLLVGGIGVMNIMLVSVKERTREIGVRKALGARNKDITVQFLIEAMTLTGLGGVLGVVLATILSFFISLLIPNLPATIVLWAVVAAIGASVFIGLAFGVWPATRAARLDPIECLRYE